MARSLIQNTFGESELRALMPSLPYAPRGYPQLTVVGEIFDVNAAVTSSSGAGLASASGQERADHCEQKYLGKHFAAVSAMAATTWKGNIAFGLVSIPVRLVRAARRERVRFRQVYREGASERPEPEPEPQPEPEQEPVKVHAARSSTESLPAPVIRPVTQSSVVNDNPIPRAEILKGYEVAPERFVTFTPSEVAAVRPQTSGSIEIASFARLAEIDPIYFDASYYVVPQPAGEKPYALLFAALRKAGYVALGELAMHGREHVAVIRAGETGMILETLFFAKEIHREDQYQAKTSLATAPELKLAEAFIQALAAKFEPEQLVDQYEARLASLIDRRAREETMASSSAPAPVQTPVIDIVEALRKSLAEIRKPAAKENRSNKRSRAS